MSDFLRFKFNKCILAGLVLLGITVNWNGKCTFFNGGAQNYYQRYEFGVPLRFLSLDSVAEQDGLLSQSRILPISISVFEWNKSVECNCSNLNIVRLIFSAGWWFSLCYLVCSCFRVKNKCFEIRYTLQNLLVLQIVVASFICAMWL